MFGTRDFKLPLNNTLFKQISLGKAFRLDAWISGHNPGVRVVKHIIRLSKNVIVVEDINTVRGVQFSFDELE
jgi:hypothetical protein